MTNHKCPGKVCHLKLTWEFHNTLHEKCLRYLQFCFINNTSDASWAGQYIFSPAKTHSSTLADTTVDFPVPAEPVNSKLCPFRANSKANVCFSFNKTFYNILETRFVIPNERQAGNQPWNWRNLSGKFPTNQERFNIQSIASFRICQYGEFRTNFNQVQSLMQFLTLIHLPGKSIGVFRFLL